MNARLVGLGVAIAALVGVVAASSPKVQAMINSAAGLVGVSLTPANTDVALGPSYLVSNQPWFYGGMSTAVSPSVAQQVAGASATPVPQFSDCGCGF